MRCPGLQITLKQTGLVFIHVTSYKLPTVLHSGLCLNTKGKQIMFCVGDAVGHPRVSLNMLSDIRWICGDY